jgi:DNA (cytosine-5)-methyltransferase 1
MALRAEPLRVLSLFAGVGWLDVAVKLAVPRARTVCYVEREAYAAAALVARMEDASLDRAPVWDDVCTFDAVPWRGAVDLVCGGFPCQDISVAGNGAGLDGERSGLWREYARIVRDLRPRLVFVENSAALANRGLDRVLGDLAALGFDAEWTVLRASDVGAPHERARLFILARLPDAIGGDELRDEPGRSGGARRTGAAKPRDVGARMGHADGARLEGDGTRGAVADATRDVADAARLGRSEGGTGTGAQGKTGALGAGGTGEDVAHAVRLGYQPVEGDAVGEEWHARTAPCSDGGRVPTWPPGPDDADGWARVLGAAPDLAPAIEPTFRGVAHGQRAGLDVCVCSRNDRLHAAGNGVVSLAAAVALRVLADRRGW